MDGPAYAPGAAGVARRSFASVAGRDRCAMLWLWGTRIGSSSVTPSSDARYRPLVAALTAAGSDRGPGGLGDVAAGVHLLRPRVRRARRGGPGSVAVPAAHGVDARWTGSRPSGDRTGRCGWATGPGGRPRPGDRLRRLPAPGRGRSASRRGPRGAVGGPADPGRLLPRSARPGPVAAGRPARRQSVEDVPDSWPRRTPRSTGRRLHRRRRRGAAAAAPPPARRDPTGTRGRCRAARPGTTPSPATGAAATRVGRWPRAGLRHEIAVEIEPTATGRIHAGDRLSPGPCSASSGRRCPSGSSTAGTTSTSRGGATAAQHRSAGCGAHCSTTHGHHVARAGRTTPWPGRRRLTCSCPKNCPGCRSSCCGPPDGALLATIAGCRSPRRSTGASSGRRRAPWRGR